MPLFAIPIALPALFLTPGPALAELPLGLTITRAGATSVLFLLLRISASLTLTLLLIYTTSWNALLGALTSLRVPQVFILTLGMTYRYIHLLLRISNDMFMSRQSRIVGRMSAKDGQRMLAATAGTLLGRSLKLSEDIYLAMLSRGFRGSIVSMRPPGMQLQDWAVLLALTIIAAAGIWAGR